MRVDIFIANKTPTPTWRCYVQAVTPTNSKNIIAALEAQGEKVAVFRHTKALGKLVYETPQS